jgi:hypothetical protein
MRRRAVVYLLILIATGVGYFMTPRVSWEHLAVLGAGLLALLVAGRVFGRPWGEL